MPGAIPRFLNPRQSIHSEADSCPETLENLIRVTQQEKSVIQTYYTDDNGDVITLSVYDISGNVEITVESKTGKKIVKLFSVNFFGF